MLDYCFTPPGLQGSSKRNDVNSSPLLSSPLLLSPPLQVQVLTVSLSVVWLCPGSSLVLLILLSGPPLVNLWPPASLSSGPSGSSCRWRQIQPLSCLTWSKSSRVSSPQWEELLRLWLAHPLLAFRKTCLEGSSWRTPPPLTSAGRWELKELLVWTGSPLRASACRRTRIWSSLSAELWRTRPSCLPSNTHWGDWAALSLWTR